MAEGVSPPDCQVGLRLTVISVDEPANRRPEMRISVVPELGDEWMLLERSLHDAALHAAASAVHEPQLAQAGFVRRADELLHHGRDVTRSKGVEIELRLDGNLVRHGGIL